MIDAAILDAGDRVELLQGVLVEKKSKKPPHRTAKRFIRQALEAKIPAGWYVEEQEPITLEDSEPEPDLTVIRGSSLDYLRQHPGPEDVALVVEVSESTLVRDRVAKRETYARAGIPYYWIANLVDHRIEVLSSPLRSGYTSVQLFAPGEEVPLVIDGVEVGRIPAAAMLPPK